MRRWIVFGKQEWTAPCYKIQSGTFSDREMTCDEYVEAVATQPNTPVLLLGDHRRYLWWFRDRFYYHSRDENDPIVIKGLIIQKQQRDERRRQKAIETPQKEESK